MIMPVLWGQLYEEKREEIGGTNTGGAETCGGLAWSTGGSIVERGMGNK